MKTNSVLLLLQVLSLLGFPVPRGIAAVPRSRPVAVFIIGENEYRTAETLPAFAQAELEPRGIQCRFVHAPSTEGDPNFRGYEAIRDADVLILSVRRRTPVKEMMELIRRHVQAGRAVVGIRTASHAFAASPADSEHDAWPEFDHEVLGGDYTGHYGNKPPHDPPTLVRLFPGALGHTVLTGVTTGAFTVVSHLYKNPHPSPTLTQLLQGSIPGRPEVEPVAWVNTNLNRRVFYTSLGHPDDFKVQPFRRLLLNGILWALDLPIATPFADDRQVGVSSLPALALDKFTVADGLTLSLAVAEPAVSHPVYLSFDERGRMWVVQYLQYPFPAGLKVIGHDEYWRVRYDHWPPPPPPRHVPGADRVTIFEDRNGDGHFEWHTDFVTGLNIASAALPGRGGVWVLNPPYLLFYPDRNHDDVADGDPEVHLEGFGLEDMHAVASSLSWGPDGWLYGCQGSTCTASIRRPGLDLAGLAFKGQCIWRYQPETKRFELFAEGGYNNFGLAPDRDWRLFTGSNGGIIGVHYVQGGYYRKMWGKHGPLTNPFTFGYLEGMPDQSSQAKLSQAMAFCTTAAWPAEYRDRLLTARVLQHRIDLCELKTLGSSYAAREAHPVLSCEDPNFRPVDLKFGPDGALYIADWHESNITWNVTAEHAPSRPAHGRIYRLAPHNLPPALPTDHAALTADQWIEAAMQENPWRRDIALRLLREHPTPASRSNLAARVQKGRDASTLPALWALDASGGFTPAFASTQLHHPLPSIRTWTIRLLGDGGHIDNITAAALADLAGTEPDPQVRSQLACSARRLPARSALPIVDGLLHHAQDLKDPHLPLLIWWVVEDKLRSERPETLRWLEKPALWRAPLFATALANRLGQRFTTERTDDHFQICARLLGDAPGSAERHELLRGMAAGLAGNKVHRIPAELETSFREIWRREPADQTALEVAILLGSVEAVPVALKTLIDENTPEEDALTLMRLLAERGEERVVGTILRWLRREPSVALKTEALAAAQYFGDERIARTLIEQVPILDPPLRDRALATLATRRSWALQLLKAVDRGPFNRALVPRDIVLALQAVGGEPARPYIRKHWGTVQQAPAEKRRRIAQIRVQLVGPPGDPKAGHQLFEQTCARCHVLFGEGRRVGPDLTGIDRRNLEALLNSVIDPSNSIVPEFMPMQFRLKPRRGDDEERSLTGFLLEENNNQLMIRDTVGATISLPRQELLGRRPLQLSLMPEGLLDGFSTQQLRDLFAYLMSR